MSHRTRRGNKRAPFTIETSQLRMSSIYNGADTVLRLEFALKEDAGDGFQAMCLDTNVDGETDTQNLQGTVE